MAISFPEPRHYGVVFKRTKKGMLHRTCNIPFFLYSLRTPSKRSWTFFTT